MDILIRTDASVLIGSGHVMRCLTIAKQLKKLGHEVCFWMEPLQGNLIDLVEKNGFSVIQHMRHVELLIVDHYQLDMEWEQQMRAYAPKIVVIDDLANRNHDCDVLIDQNIVSNYLHRYDTLVPAHCKKLLGPQYLIMRDEFIEARKQQVPRSGIVETLLVFMGGSDPTRETWKVLHALQQTSTDLKRIDVVVGSSNPDSINIEHYCSHHHYYFHCQIDYMAKLIAASDFAIGAGGTAVWERSYVGLPSSVTVVADNQIASMEMAAELEAIISLGWHEKVTVDTYVQLLDSLPHLSEKIKAMSLQGLKITEGQGKPNPWLWEMVE